MMKQTFVFLTSIMLFACNHAVANKFTGNIQVVEQSNDTTPKNPKRQILIEELKKLRQAIRSNDKEQIAVTFQFPLSDSSFSIFIDDSTYNAQYNSNNNKITKEMFMQYFKEISESILLDRVKNLFNYINVDSLSHRNTLKHDAYIKTQPCYYSYEIEVVKSRVTLSMNSNSNKNYKGKKLPDGEIPENSSEYCEHNFWWVFRFDGRRLHLESISGAD